MRLGKQPRALSSSLVFLVPQGTVSVPAGLTLRQIPRSLPGVWLDTLTRASLVTCPREASALTMCPGWLGQAAAAGLTGGDDGQTEPSLEAESLPGREMALLMPRLYP